MLPHSIRFAADETKNPDMLELCLITFFVHYFAIINLRELLSDFSGGVREADAD